MFRVFEIDLNETNPVKHLGDYQTPREALELGRGAKNHIIRLAYNLENAEFSSAAGGRLTDHDAIKEARELVEASGALPAPELKARGDGK